jgi:glutamate synthase domain-containing protein 2/glutamate synthase domain-containing protein 1/glutamate synthase domain-containing protein 3
MNTTGLYRPKYEHSSCGVGCVANIAGERSHAVIEDALTMLRNLIHRGALGSDGKTGDGAGIMTQLPHQLFMQELYRKGIMIPSPGEYAVGMVFMPPTYERVSDLKHMVENICRQEGAQFLSWREVPVDPSCLGEIALASIPAIKQFFLKFSSEESDREMRSWVIRRQLEKEAISRNYTPEEFYIPSLSTQTIVYKGMLAGRQTGEFFRDLQSLDYRSAMAVIHQRYSTNTFPSWALAQPFRMVAHNGEINTIQGNRRKMQVREKSLFADHIGENMSKILPVAPDHLSDSGTFDTVFELLVQGGRSPEHAMMMMIPEPFGEDYTISRDKRDFYQYHASLMEPWDGPAAMVFSDGRRIGATVDRNGLRPARYTITRDGRFILGSEAGVLEVAPEDVLRKGHLQPGKMVVVDMERGRIIPDRETKSKLSRRRPYRRWLETEVITLKGLFRKGVQPRINHARLEKQTRLFGYSREDIDTVIAFAEKAQEAVGSMGNDSSLAFRSGGEINFYSFFRQDFAQVTNPPIDPYRENMVMSLMSFIGRERNLLTESPLHCKQLKIPHPVLTNDDMKRLKESHIEQLPVAVVEAGYSTDKGLAEGIQDLCARAQKAIEEGAAIVILSDRQCSFDRPPIPALLALSAVNTHLVTTGLRHLAGLIVETGDPLDTVRLALLVGYGASAVNPYTVFEIIADRCENAAYAKSDEGIDNYITALKRGLLKIMSKMGVSTIRSYRGSALFESLGLARSLLDRWMPGTGTAVGGIDAPALEQLLAERWKKSRTQKELPPGGRLRYTPKGAYHLLTPSLVKKLRKALSEKDFAAFSDFSNSVDAPENRSNLRSLLTICTGRPSCENQVESVEDILPRFVSGAMSLGSISSQAHETIAQAFNSIGSMSNCGEGGELDSRNGTSSESRIRQVASGRFGVTTEYLRYADEIQIKLAQGAKPGEGGQLPGAKVTQLVAKVRKSTEGVTLISPPPHHDIYSIEDLAQLIYDMKSVNSEATISVKLAAKSGVGTVAAGVVKAGAHSIVISGHDGGTGASPVSSIFTAGLPWEVGLAETQQTLTLNGFRKSVELQVDGKLLTGRDIVIAALFGAEKFAFGTALLMAEGCIMCRKCHLNRCPVGIATQNSEYEHRFAGDVEDIITYLTFVAREVREWMIRLGVQRFEDLVGRVDLLAPNEELCADLPGTYDFSKLLTRIEPIQSRTYPQRSPAGDAQLLERIMPALVSGQSIEIESRLTNRDRSVGAALSAEVIRRYGMSLKKPTFRVLFSGYAGQSFASFLAPGVDFRLAGEVNDYLGKGMNGGRVVVVPPEQSGFRSHASVIAGNVALFGATGGEVYLNGRAGERFGVRNSGARAVVCGVGNHGCEYMTGGVVVVLGPTGINFAAGMSGGIAYVLDQDELFDTRCNLDMVDLEPVEHREDRHILHELVTNHSQLTGSSLSARIIRDWEEMRPLFVKVIPREYRAALARIRASQSRGDDTPSMTEEVE